MEVLEAIRSRRSVRRWLPDPVPEEVMAQILDAGRWAPSAGNFQPWAFIVVQSPEGKGRLQNVEFGGKRLSSARREFVNLEGILAANRQAGVDAVLLCPWVSLTRNTEPAGEALAACQIQNDSLAALAGQHPGRVAALGVVPLQDVALAVAELERLMRLGLKGVEIGSAVSDVYPGDPRFGPFWEACQRLNAIVFLHPAEGGARSQLREFYMWNVIGNPMETTIAAGHMILSGTLEAYPNLKIILAHGGGALPYLRGRLDRGFAVRPEISRNLNYPFDMGSEQPADVVRAAELGEAAEAQILGGNAARLLGWAG